MMHLANRTIHFRGLGAFLGLGILCNTWAIQPETPTQGPFKSPFEWPTFWMVEELDNPNSHPSPVATESGLIHPAAAPADDIPEISNPRTQRFKSKLGQLYSDENSRPLPVQTMPAALVPHAENGKSFRHWLKGDILSHAPFLASLSNGEVRPGECRISYFASNESEILQPYDKISLNKGSEDGINIGDMYELYEVGPSGYAFSSSHSIGREIIPNGMAQIVSVKGKTSTARLTQCFGTISRTTRASPYIKGDKRFAVMAYATVTGDRPVARVVWIPGAGQLPQPFHYVVVDKGVEGGFHLADHVMLLNKKGGKMSESVLGEGLVVHIESHSATVLVHDVFPGIINPGDFAMAVQSPQQ